MIPKKWHIRLDMQRQYDNEIIEMVRQDTYSNELIIHLVQNGVNVKFDDIAVIAIIFDKSDDTQVIGSCEVIRDGLLKYVVDYQAITALGITTVTLKLLDGNMIETSTSFNINVIQDPFNGTDGSVESTSEYPILTEMINNFSNANAYIEVIKGWLVNPTQFIGPQGPQGPQGIQGPRGLQGSQGPQGIKGDKGDKGDRGLVGPPGPKGDTGSQGIQGPKGDTGIQGPRGLQGIQGPKGDTGSQGIQGPSGIRGPKGDTGLQGSQGIQGLQGPQGDVGPQGPQGIQGPQGPLGPKGDSAASVEISGYYTFTIIDGNLYINYPDGGEVPNYMIDTSGDLILTI